jgi:diguanylate cyclase (GGDEF)-like protein
MTLYTFDQKLQYVVFIAINGDIEVTEQSQIVLLIGRGDERERLLEALDMEGWSVHEVGAVQEIPPREQLEADLVIVTSDINLANLNKAEQKSLGSRVVCLVQQGSWAAAISGNPLELIAADASLEEMRHRLLRVANQIEQQMWSRLGLPSGVQGEELWDIMPATDWVTGLDNRIRFLQEMQKNISRAKRYQRPFCCVLVRIDNFGFLKSNLSEEIMETLLEEVAGWLEISLRDADLLARMQGDIFGLLLTETEQERGEIVVDRIRNNLQNFQFGCELPQMPTFSVGMSAYEEGEQGLDSMLKKAQKDLH